MSGLSKWLRRTMLVPLALLLAASGTVAASQSVVEGVWLTDAATELTILPCRAGYCGYITKIVVPDRLKAKYGAELKNLDPAAYTDVNNKDPKLRNRPIQGLQILTLRATNNPYYYEGEIYNPEDGNVYAGAVEVVHANMIRLKGCVLYVLCQDQQWARVR